MRRVRPSTGLAVALACVATLTVFSIGGAGASDVEPDAREALVEIVVTDRFQVEDLIAADVDLAEYVRENYDGTITLQAYVNSAERAALAAQGYEFGATIEDYDTWLVRKAQRAAAMAAEEAALDLAEGEGAIAYGAREGFSLLAAPPTPLPPDQLTAQRADYFENYAGRFLYVEAKTLLGTATGGPTIAMSWRSATGDFGAATNMGKNNDPDVASAVSYMYHRQLIRIAPGDPMPAVVRVAASNGDVAEREVKTWMGGGLPPNPPGFLSDFHTGYLDPTQVYNRMDGLATEFPDLIQAIPLPHKTPGYQRKASATMAGTYNTASTSAPSTAQQAQAVVLWSNVMGHEGGNQIRAEFRNPGAPDSPLSVTVTGGNPLGGSDIVVDLATDSTGAPASTAAQVRAAVNADPAASALVTATLWATNAGAGIVQPRALVALSDFLAAPSYVQRGPFQPKLYRIAKVRDGSKVGVYLFCQQHAREWVTPVTCVETAERLLRNYAIDPNTKQLVDNLDIFIVPSVNPDGAHTSLYDFQSKRRNMANYCAPDAAASMPSGRNSIGVDLNRNNSVGSIFDGYFGASSSCTSDVYSGPFEISEPEIRNEHWVVDTFPNIKFSNNIHTSGGYFMWAPGAYIQAGRVTLPAPNHGVEAYFFKAADQILNRIKEWRGTVVLPERTGPIADVLYSAGGNSADDQFYRRGIIGYSFEAGADRFATIQTTSLQPTATTLNQAAAAGATAVRLTSLTGLVAGMTIRLDTGANEEIVVIDSIVTPNPASPAPNVNLTAPLALAHAAGVASVPRHSEPGATAIRLASLTNVAAGTVLTIGTGATQETATVASVVSPNPANPAPNVNLTAGLAFTHWGSEAVTSPVTTGTSQSGVGFFPDYATEGKHEANEFANGNYGLLEAALEYSRDATAPETRMVPDGGASQTPITATFEWVNEPSVVYYTTDGSTPTTSSPEWNRQDVRQQGQRFEITETTTFKWISVDIRGNTSAVQSARFAVETVAPVTTASLSPAPTNGFYPDPWVTLTADDDVPGGGSGVAGTQYRVDGGPWQTYTGRFRVTGDGDHTVEFFSTDEAGNVEATKSITFAVDGDVNLEVVGSVLRCNGPLGAITVPKDLGVAEGASCALDGTTVVGHLKVKAGGTVTSVDSNVTRNVECLGTCTLESTGMNHLLVGIGGSASATSSTVRGIVECNDCVKADLVGSSIAGDVTSTRQSGPARICGNTIGGTVIFKWSTSSFTTCEGNSIGGKLELLHNTSQLTLSVVGNQVGQNIRLERNTASAISLTNNAVARNIFCVVNTPTPTASGNTASSIDAACGQS